MSALAEAASVVAASAPVVGVEAGKPVTAVGFVPRKNGMETSGQMLREPVTQRLSVALGEIAVAQRVAVDAGIPTKEI